MMADANDGRSRLLQENDAVYYDIDRDEEGGEESSSDEELKKIECSYFL